MRLLAARYVLPISHAPIERGAVAIDADQIVAVGLRDALTITYPDAEVSDLGEAAILPGFVNCHSHLELTTMRGALDDVEHDFSSWLLRLNGIREKMSDADIISAAIAGAREGAAAGVTCFADIGRMAFAGLHALKEVGLRGTVYQETDFSPDNATAEADFKKLVEKFNDLRKSETSLVRIGLSPHSPYTVSSRLFEMIAQWSILDRIPISIHAAESVSEHELLTTGTGFFTDVYEKYGVDWSSPHCTPIEYLERLGVLAARPLLAHCVHASESDIDKIASNGAAIAHCPKSNAKFGHGSAPLERFLDEGVAVGLGSDSVASNNVCDLLEEGRFAVLTARNRADSRRFISASEILQTATLGGARALGLDQSIGSLEPGKQADLIAISLDHPAQQPITDIHAALVFASNARDVRMTMVGGKIVYAAGSASGTPKGPVSRKN
jgi:cytosine/adenosine deaminase-related metal-dependent hydrolase